MFEPCEQVVLLLFIAALSKEGASYVINCFLCCLALQIRTRGLPHRVLNINALSLKLKANNLLLLSDRFFDFQQLILTKNDTVAFKRCPSLSSRSYANRTDFERRPSTFKVLTPLLKNGHIRSFFDP